MIEPKRHFEKPLALSPLIAIDRERCILCYRCVRFSQEIAEDWQLIFTERGAHTFVGTHDGHPYVAPFSGNIIELCPVGALTSQPYRFRARPWDIEGAGGICTLCPSQCNVEFTVRDEKVLRVLAREHPEVDDGWLCDKGRFAYQAIHVDERITAAAGPRRRRAAARLLGARAGRRGRAWPATGAASARSSAGRRPTRRASCSQRLLREGLDSARHRLAAPAAAVDLELARALAAPALQATVPDLEFAHTVLVLGCEPLDDAPILDLRIRKGVRRNGVKLAIATARPSALDPNAALVVRYAPGDEAAFLAGARARRWHGAAGDPDDRSRALADAAARRRRGRRDPVGRALAAPTALASLLRIARRLGLAGRDGAGLLEIPAGANGRGLREAGALPNAGPGYADRSTARARRAPRSPRAAAGGEVTALYLFQTDPVRDLPDRAAVGARAAPRRARRRPRVGPDRGPRRARQRRSSRPSRSAEKEGTVVHPDGRLQRLRVAIAHPGRGPRRLVGDRRASPGASGSTSAC